MENKSKRGLGKRVDECIDRASSLMMEKLLHEYVALRNKAKLNANYFGWLTTGFAIFALTASFFRLQYLSYGWAALGLLMLTAMLLNARAYVKSKKAIRKLESALWKKTKT